MVVYQPAPEHSPSGLGIIYKISPSHTPTGDYFIEATLQIAPPHAPNGNWSYKTLAKLKGRFLNGYVSFDFAPILREELEINAPNTEALRILVDSHKKYSISFHEYEDGQIIDIQHVVLKQLLLTTYPRRFQNTWLDQWIEGRKPLINPQYDDQIVLIGRDSPAWYSFLLKENVTVPRNGKFPFKIDFAFDDGSAFSNIGYWDLETTFPGSGDLIQFPIGFEMLGLKSFETNSEVSRYTITLIGDTINQNPISEPLHIVPIWHPQGTSLVFQNCLGGLDTIYLTGEEKIIPQVKRTINRRTSIDTPLEKHISAQNIQETLLIEKFTGFQTEDGQIWLSDLLSSPKVWRSGHPLKPDAGLIPINISTDSLTIEPNKLVSSKIRYEIDENIR